MTGESTRRRYLRELTTAAAVGLAGCPARSDTPDDESTLEPLPKRWNVSIRDPAPPTFGPDGLYVSARYGHVSAGGGDVRVIALTPDGSERWRATTRDGTSGVGLGDGTAYVGSSDGRVYAFDAASGSRRWQYRYGSTEGFETGSWLRPTVVGDVVVATAEHAIDDGTVAHAVVGLDTASGERRWRQPIGDNAFTVPVVVDSAVVFGADDGHVYAVEAASGEFRWRFETGYGVRGSPVRHGDTLFIGSRDDRLYGLGIDGTERWTVEAGNDVDAGPAVTSGRVYAGSDDYTTYAREAATGSEAWRHEGQAPVTALAVGGKTVYTGTDKGTVRAHTAETGEVRWSADIGETERRVRWLAVRDDRLYVVERSGIRAYGLTGGASG